MSQKQRRILRAFLWAAVMARLAALPAQAKPEYQEVFAKAYRPASASPLEKASCQACHVAAGPPRRNVYGAAVEKALDAARTKTLTQEILRQAETVDSDGDGAGNQAELTAGSLPGDANSLPPQAAAATPPAASAPPPATVPPSTSKPAVASRPTAAKAKPRPAAAAAPTPVKKKTAPPPKVKAASPAAAVAAAKTKAEESGAARPVAASKPSSPPARPSAPAARASTPAAAAASPQPARSEEAAPVEKATPAPPTTPPPVTAAPTASLVSELFNRLVPPHSFHPVIVHFPIALFLFGGICEVLGAWKRRPLLRAAGALNMTAASITALGAVATGFLAMWREGFPLSGTTLIHLCLAVAATASMGATALLGWSFIHLHRERTSRIYWFLLTVSLLLIGLVGHFGGELVYGS